MSKNDQKPCLEDKYIALRTLAMPADANPSGDIFGGWIMSQMDIAGAFYARQITKSRLVTVAVESMNFLLPVFIGDEVSCYCSTEKVGKTSVAVKIETYVLRDRFSENGSDDNIKVTEAIFTYVSIDRNRRPKPIDQTLITKK